MVKILSISLPEWFIDKYIPEDLLNRSDYIKELIELGYVAKYGRPPPLNDIPKEITPIEKKFWKNLIHLDTMGGAAITIDSLENYRRLTGHKVTLIELERIFQEMKAQLGVSKDEC